MAADDLDDTTRNNKDSGNDDIIPDLKLEDITDGFSDRGNIPLTKFVDDIDAFADTFNPPATSELLIGAFTDLHNKYKSVESSLSSRQAHLKEKIPELEHSLTLVQNLLRKQESEEQGNVRYCLADNIYAKARVDYTVGKVYLWLGANVMLEYTYQEAADFLERKLNKAQTELEETIQDLAIVRDQIVTAQVNTSRIFNWDVRRTRQPATATSAK